MPLLRSLSSATSVDAAFLGRNGRIAYTARTVHDRYDLENILPGGRGRRVLIGKSGVSRTSLGEPAYSPNGRGLRRLTPPNLPYDPAYSSHGRFIVYGQAADLYVMTATGHHRRRVAHDRHFNFEFTEPDWQPLRRR